LHKLNVDYYSISKSSAIFAGAVDDDFLNFFLHSLELVYYDYGVFMIFVGRKNEANHIIRELKQGNNVILGGKYGIGRTSLIKYLAAILLNDWCFVFIDFSQAPVKMSEKLMKELGLFVRFKKTGKKMGYKSMRYRIANVESLKRKKTVIVFDNVAKLTPQKIIFLRYLILERRFQFIVIVENFLPPKNLFELKAQLMPAKSIKLSNLNVSDIKILLRCYSDQNQLDWTDKYRNNLATLTNGYPLGLAQMLRNNLTKKSKFD
jgi:hypothetical protein